MPGLVPGIHAFLKGARKRKAWMAGTSPGHDESIQVKAALGRDFGIVTA